MAKLKTAEATFITGSMPIPYHANVVGFKYVSFFSIKQPTYDQTNVQHPQQTAFVTEQMQSK